MHVQEFRDIGQNVTDIFVFQHFVKVDVFYLALDDEHVLVTLEIVVVVDLEGHHLADFLAIAHEFLWSLILCKELLLYF